HQIELPGLRDGVHPLQARDDVRREAAHAWRRAAATGRIDDFREDLDGHDQRVPGDTGKRLSGRVTVTGRDAGHVRAVRAFAQQAGGRGAGSDLLVEAVRTHRLTDASNSAGVARLFD